MRRQAEPLRFLQAPESGRQGCVGAHSQSLMLHRGDFTLIAIRTVAAQGGAVQDTRMTVDSWCQRRLRPPRREGWRRGSSPPLLLLPSGPVSSGPDPSPQGGDSDRLTVLLSVGNIRWGTQAGGNLGDRQAFRAQGRSLVLRGREGRAVACLRTHLGWVQGQGCSPWGVHGPRGSSAGQAWVPTGICFAGFQTSPGP